MRKNKKFEELLTKIIENNTMLIDTNKAIVNNLDKVIDSNNKILETLGQMVNKESDDNDC